MAKGVMLITAHTEPVMIKESVQEIIKRRNEVGEMGDLMYTATNTLDDEHEGYESSCIGGLYRGVREVEMPEKKKK